MVRTAGVGYVPNVGSRASDRQLRLELALPRLDAAARQRARERGWHVELLDPEDADERAILIRLAHPDLDDAVGEGKETVDVGGEPMNPRLHLAIHEVVATQIIDDDPPEAFETAQRLVASGRDHHEVLHMLGFVASQRIWDAMQDEVPSRAEYADALAALPGSFDDSVSMRPNRAARRAQARGARRRRRR